MNRSLLNLHARGGYLGTSRISVLQFALVHINAASSVGNLLRSYNTHRSTFYTPQRPFSAKSEVRDSCSALILTSAAAEKIKEIERERRPDKILKVSVSAGGCHGFKYVLELVCSPEPDDVYVSGVPHFYLVQ